LLQALIKVVPTFSQLARGCRKKKFRRTNKLDLQSCPQKKIYCIKLIIRTPKKPHSAKRKCMWVYILSTDKKVFCYIPGIGHNIQKHSTGLMRGGRRRDIPGMKYSAIRGVLDFSFVYGRCTSRSKYGLKKVSY